ncbi:MAG: type III secretion inner membrane ring lipoprotein SctJ, partial [Methylococcaceae bacterium]
FPLMILLLLTGCKEDLYSNLSENEAVQMWAVLLRNKIDSEKFNTKDGAFGIRVETDQISEAVQILKGCGFPKSEYKDMGSLFKKEGLISSPIEEKARYIHGLSQSLGETLSQIDGVIIARVHIVLPDENPFSGSIKPSAASIFIKHRSDSEFSDIKSKIKQIVAKSIEGLQYNQVAVALLPVKGNSICGELVATNDSTVSPTIHYFII